MHSETAPRLTWGAIVAATLILLAADSVLRVAWAIELPKLVNDLQVFYRAADRFDPYQLYSQIVRTTYRPFVSPPTLLPWISWLPLLPFPLAWIVWSVAGATAYLVAAKRFVGFPDDILALLSFGALEALIAGQITLFLAAAMMQACLLMSSRPLASGILFGIIATLKPQILLALPLGLVASREWRLLLATLVTGLVIGFASLLLQGMAMWLKWLLVVKQFAGWLPNSQFVPYGLTPTNLAGLAGFGPTLTDWIFAAGIALGLFTVWQVFRNSGSPQLRLGALVVGYLLCSKYALVYEMALIAPLGALWLLDRKAPPYCWIAGALAIACSTGQYTELRLGAFAPPMMALALVLRSRRESEALA